MPSKLVIAQRFLEIHEEEHETPRPSTCPVCEVGHREMLEKFVKSLEVPVEKAVASAMDTWSANGYRMANNGVLPAELAESIVLRIANYPLQFVGISGSEMEAEEIVNHTLVNEKYLSQVQ
jgi:hypothetical protein